jgi:hypothetical protein
MLDGGAGADTFRYIAGDGNDFIYDFSAAEGDKVELYDVTFVSGAFVGTYVAELSDGALIRAANGHVWTGADFV